MPEADTSIGKLEVKKLNGSSTTDEYTPHYDFVRKAYIVNVKGDVEKARISAYPKNANAKAAVSLDKSAALAAAGASVGTLDSDLAGGETKCYIAVTPSTHDSDTHYPKEVHELIINRMSASTAIELKFGEHTLALSADGSTYDFVLPASTSGLDNSVDTLTATAENAGAKVKISDVADHVIPADAT